MTTSLMPMNMSTRFLTNKSRNIWAARVVDQNCLMAVACGAPQMRCSDTSIFTMSYGLTVICVSCYMEDKMHNTVIVAHKI